MLTGRRSIRADAPENVLAALGKDPRLIPYGDGNSGMPLAYGAGARLDRADQRFFLRANNSIP